MADLLVTSLSGLRAYQAALATTSHNIANVGNEDYSRQRVELNARLPEQFGSEYIGQGVDVQDIKRIIDDFNTVNLRDFTSSTSRLSLFESYASRVENLIADDQAGLMPALDTFFNALNDVANDPSANAPRVALLGATEILETRFNSLAEDLAEIQDEVEGRIRGEVDEINAITTELARLNDTINRLSGSQNRPADLLDQRDALIKQLAEKISVNVVEQNDGTLNILAGTGQLLVTGSVSVNLVAQPDAAQPDRVAVALQGSGATVDITSSIAGGELGGLLDFRNSILDSAQNRLGRTAIALADTFNAQHIQGYDLNGDMGTNFFSTVPSGHLQGMFGGDYLNNGVDVGDTLAFDLQFDGQTVSVSYTVGAGDTNQDIADGLLFGATGIVADANVTDNGDGTYTLAGTTPGVSLTFSLHGSNIQFESAGGPSPLGNNLVLTNFTDGVADDASVDLLALGSSSTSTSAFSVSAGSPATFVGPSTTAVPNTTNTGTGSLVYSITDVTALTVSDYEVSFDGVNYNVLRLSDGVTVASGAGPLNVDGMEITPGGAANAGDSFFIRPTRLGALSFQGLVRDPADIAAATPIRAITSSGNLGSVGVSQSSVVDALDGDLRRSVNIFFDPTNPAGTFDVVDNATGTVLQNDVVFNNGMTVSQNGWQVQLSGQPQPGDTLTIEENTGAATDSTNMLLLADLQSQGIMDNGTSSFEQSYSALTAEVGTVTQQVKINHQVEESLLQGAIERRESVSGVNLDEEAADLIRFQQAYQALSRIVQTSQTLFESLISAV